MEIKKWEPMAPILIGELIELEFISYPNKEAVNVSF